MMPNIQPNIPAGRDVESGSSIAQFSTSSQNLQTKSIHNNGGKEKKSNPVQLQPSLPNPINAVSEMSALMAALKGNNGSAVVNKNNSKKSSKKKQQRKQLHLATGVNGVPEACQSAGMSPGPNDCVVNTASFTAATSNSSGYASVSPASGVHASTSSRYLSNLSYLPQFQYMQNMHNVMELQLALNSIAIQQKTHAVSAPNTPLIHGFQAASSSSIPCSPLMTPQSNVHFFQNMMQHPLLNHTLNVNNNANGIIAGFNEKGQHPLSKDSPKRKRNNKANDKEPTSEDKKFENYLSAEEVERGLQNGTLFEGVLRINPKQFQQGFISTSDREEQDMFIDGIKNRNRALEGDVVVVQLIEEAEKHTDIVQKIENDVEDETKMCNNGNGAENVTQKKTNSENGIEDDLEEKLSENGTEDDIENKQKAANEPEEETERKKQKRGKVVFIKEKVHTRYVIGNLKLMPDKNRQRALFIPRDHRVPRLNIPFSSWPNNFYQDAKKYEDTIFLAKIIDWFDTRFALGKILENVGQAGDMQTETKAILAQNDLDVTPYGPDVRDLFPRLDYTIPEEEIALREDCRNLCIFSIDPFNCRDIDDAISCRELSNGNYEVGVHISDVAHYLAENTELDKRVSQKATTIYLVERAYHMLPDELCMLCSLFPGVDKLAFSVFWEITKDGEVLHHRFAKTVINSCAQLAYEHAQAILDSKDIESDFPETYNDFEFKHIKKTIEIIGGMARKFRKTRFESGALRIDQPKLSFRLSSKDGLPESYSFYEIKESNQLIEEFMLLANMTVAKRIYEDHPNLAFLRSHPPPSGHMMRNLARSLKPLGIDLDISSAGNLHRSLLNYTGPDCSDGKAMVLNMLCAKPMTRAKYFCAAGCDDDDFHHYALNVPLYTHFTSPIRRYADIMVHRLLAASLGYREVPIWEVDTVKAVAAQCNKQKYNAKKAGEMSSDLYMLKYIEMHSPVETDAVVVEVKEKYIDVIVAVMGLNRRIFFNNDFPGEFNCVKQEGGNNNKMSKMMVTWPAEEEKPEVKQIIETFSILKVVMVKDKEGRMMKVDTKMIRPDN